MERFSKFISLFENFNTGVVFHDSQTHVIFANSAALKLLGLTMDQILGKASADPDWHFIREDGSRLPLEEFPVAQVLNSKKPIKNFVGGVVRSDLAQPVWLICNGHPEFDDKGEVQIIIVNMTDISEQKYAEERLNEQLNFTRDLIDSMLDGFSVLDKDGTQLDVNPAFCKMTGFTRDELIGLKPPFPYWPPEEYENIQNAFEKTLDKHLGNFEMVYMRKNGERFSAIVAPSHIKDKNGNIINFSASVKDISSREKSQKVIKEIAERLSRTYAQTNVGVWSWNIASDKVVWSEELFRIVGYDPKSPVPSFPQMESIHTPESWQRLKAAVDKAFASGESYQLEIEYVRPDGSHRNVFVFGGVKHNSQGEVVELYGSVQDITEKKQAEIKLKAALDAAENAVNVKSRFLDIAAHELRTPVSGFSLLLQFTQKKFEKGVPIDSVTLQRLRTQVDRISQLVIELLDVSRLERGVLTLKPSRTDIVSLMNQCIADFKLREPDRQISFSTSNDFVEFYFDNLRIYQVASNLIDNAIKYTPENSPIEISLEKIASNVRISVKDYGDGISEELQASLFDPFFRGSTEFTDVAGGLGLGLYISREIMALHDGTIGVTSQLSAGSTFYFELPIENTSL